MPTIKSDELVVFNHGQILHGKDTVQYFASVKNTPEGKAWIKQLRKKNRQYRIVYFSTGTNRRERFAMAGREMRTYYGGQDAGFKLPHSVAERFRVYLYHKEFSPNEIKFTDVVV